MARQPRIDVPNTPYYMINRAVVNMVTVPISRPHSGRDDFQKSFYAIKVALVVLLRAVWQAAHFCHTECMIATKKNITISITEEVNYILKLLAERDQESVATKTERLIELAL